MNNFNNKDFTAQLEAATAFHGHLCLGQLIGVRMAMLGLQQLGITDPYGQDRKKLLVYVEATRCFADAVMSVSGCRVGKRSFKIVDIGKLAATFILLATNRGVRISIKQQTAMVIQKRYPHLAEAEAEKLAYQEMVGDDLLQIEEVAVNLLPEDTPGTPMVKTICTGCGDTIVDERHLLLDNRLLCRPCAGGEPYYALLPSDQPIGKGGRT